MLWVVIWTGCSNNWVLSLRQIAMTVSYTSQPSDLKYFFFGNNANHKKCIFIWKVQIRSMGSMESASIIIALKLYSYENDTNSSIAGSKPQASQDREGEQERLRRRVSPPDWCKRWTESWWGRWVFLWRGGPSLTCCLVGKQCRLSLPKWSQTRHEG